MIKRDGFEGVTPNSTEPILAGAYTLNIRGQTFDFLGSRTMFWREQSTLFAADLHWGKTEVFQKHGIPIPRGVLKEDLDRLSSALAQTKAERLIVLGDLIHSTKGLTPDVIDEIAKWRNQNNFYFQLVLGNHDRNFRSPIEWKIDEITGEFSEDDFIFSHDEVKNTDKFAFSGHLHPMARLYRKGDSLRLPCFWVRKDCAQLPAFSFFTGGVDVSPREGDLLLVIADGQVIKV